MRRKRRNYSPVFKAKVALAANKGDEKLDWVDWFNNRRILEPIGNIPLAEYELMYYQQFEESSAAA